MDEARAARLLRDAGADSWGGSPAAFAATLGRSMARAFQGRIPDPAEEERFLRSLHLRDLALACACAEGNGPAWDHFMTEYRSVLYRAADALQPGGGAREVADALYAELWGVRNPDAASRRSLFEYFHGRSSLGTWLRALVSQRFVDRVREQRRLAPLPEDEGEVAAPSPARAPDPDRARFESALNEALGAAIAALAPRDRLRLGCYYAQEMTLAAIGRLTGEHEATVSRHLARTRRALRDEVERRLREGFGFADREIAECFASATADPGPLDLDAWLNEEVDRKNPPPDRSPQEDLP
jgi:RNA polymerase sigma-70 factor (ECF subfamily)